MKRTKKFPFINQLSTTDCGPTCLRMVSNYYGKCFENNLDNDSISAHGMSLGEMQAMAEMMEFEAVPVSITLESLKTKAPLPAIIHWGQNHYVVIYKIKKDLFYIADPAFGLAKYKKEEFLSKWFPSNGLDNQSQKGIALLLEPKKDFEVSKDMSKSKWKKFTSVRFLKKYLFLYKFHLIQLVIALFVGSTIQFSFPFITRSIVDYGISEKNSFFLLLILFFQICLFLINICIEFIRSQLLLHISSRINILIISDFFVKLMKLPLRFFTFRVTGDLVQRIRDHERVERFITNSLLRSIFSVFSIGVFSIVLFLFSPIVFSIFAIGITLEISWIFFFLGKLKTLDNKSFALNAEDQNKVFELISGIQDIKLNNIEEKKRWEWEGIQSRLFKVSLNRLYLNQYQEGGQRFLSYLQVILITFSSALLTIQEVITLGTMMAVIFIIGQLNAPVSTLINFVLEGQRAKLSLDRLIEIHERKEEEGPRHAEKTSINIQDILVDNLSFSYGNIKVLDNLSFLIPKNKVTAIVGVSGSGKTTLLKLLLKFYEPQTGNIIVGDTTLKHVNNTFWRSKCGAVLQDSFIFSDTIAHNIALNEKSNESIDIERLKEACRIANVDEFVDKLPLKFDTKIGQSGVGLSQGQRQRILIARAVYKNPDFLFFDEATNALDAENEKAIINNLEKFYKGKTVVIVAHRLSTVKNANQIIVLGNGKVLEYGTHKDLVSNREKYFKLIQNQLELGA